MNSVIIAIYVKTVQIKIKKKTLQNVTKIKKTFVNVIFKNVPVLNVVQLHA